MITFSRLGHYGRLGNQLFQVAATLACAAEAGDEAVFPPWHYAEYFRNPVRTETLPASGLPVWEQSGGHYSPLPKQKDLDLLGYFQSARYFANVADRVRAHFQPSTAVAEAVEARYGALDFSRLVAVHVRRGDYLSMLDWFPVLPLGYYALAARLFGDDWRYLIFSDDPDWCRDCLLPILPHGSARIAEDAPDHLHLFLIARCAHQIIANSSFSWWGAWLNANPRKVVVAPCPWFGPDNPGDPTDVVPADWIALRW